MKTKHVLREGVRYPINYRGRSWYVVIRNNNDYHLWQDFGKKNTYVQELDPTSMFVRLAEAKELDGKV